MDIGINFRSTSGYVTDGANEVYCLGDQYPTTRGGVTFGWSTVVSIRDRSASVDRRLAGTNFASSIGIYFRLDLPSAGQYDIHLAVGDATNLNRVEWDLNDTTTNLAQYRNGGNQLVQQFMDASGVIREVANWPSQEVKITKTFATTQLRLVVASTMVINSNVGHIRVVSAGNRRRRVICGGE